MDRVLCLLIKIYSERSLYFAKTLAVVWLSTCFSQPLVSGQEIDTIEFVKFLDSLTLEDGKDIAEEIAKDGEEEGDLLDLDLNQLSTTVVADTEIDPVVTGVSKTAESLTEAPGIVDVITAKDIEQFGARNLFEVLRFATGTGGGRDPTQIPI